MTSTTSSPIRGRLSWYRGLSGKHWRVLTASFLGWVFDGYEAYALVIVIPFVLKSMLTPVQFADRAIWAGAAIGVTLLGWGIGGLAGGVLADYLGRKRMMIYSVFCYALFSGVTAFATDFWTFCFLRFITGFAMGSEWSTGVALLAETWPNHARPKGAGFLQSGFGFGTLIAALVWFGLSQANPLGQDTWRLVFVIGALPAFFCLYIRRAVDESERWLEAIRLQRWAATEGAAASATTGRGKRPFTLSEIFREPEGRRRALLALLLSMTTTIGWWAISSWLPQFATQMASAAGAANATQSGLRAVLLYTGGAVAAYLLSGFLADLLGRRLYLFLTFLGSLITTALVYLWTTSLEGLLWASVVNGFFTLGCAYSWMAIYPAELFTSSVRATAASFIFNAARLIAWVFPILAGTLIHAFGSISRAAMMLGTVYIIGLIVPWFMPETRGKPLPE
jgi:MFS family permease